MPPDDHDSQGTFSAALVDGEQIRRFLSDRVQPLKDEEEGLAKPWRSGFRGKLPFYGLLDERQKTHLRGIFAHMLPSPEVEIGVFDREERILLDVLAETYVTQARVFAELMGEHDYQVTSVVKRDVPGRVIALTLSDDIDIRIFMEIVMSLPREDAGSKGTCASRRRFVRWSSGPLPCLCWRSIRRVRGTRWSFPRRARWFRTP